MEAQTDCCACSVCGTRCTGHFGGCPSVWAAVSAPRPLAMADSDLQLQAAPTAVAVMDAELAIDWNSKGFEPRAKPASATWRPPEPRTPESKRRLTVVGIVVAVVGLGLGLVLAAGGGSEPATAVNIAANRPPELQFKPIAISEGVTAERNWRLEGSTGHRFIGTLTFTNTNETPASVTFTETLPKTLANTIEVVLFNPFPLVIDPDPVVQWTLPVEANSSISVTYEISVPPDGADASRLDQWAKDLEAEQAAAKAEAQAALDAAQTAAERAYAQALIDAARENDRDFNPTPNAAGCKFCGGTPATSPPPSPTTTVYVYPTCPTEDCLPPPT